DEVLADEARNRIGGDDSKVELRVTSRLSERCSRKGHFEHIRLYARLPREAFGDDCPPGLRAVSRVGRDDDLRFSLRARRKRIECRQCYRGGEYMPAC